MSPHHSSVTRRGAFTTMRAYVAAVTVVSASCNLAVVLAACEKSGAWAIVHLAALQVPFCKADPVRGASVSVVGTVNVFEAARKLGIQRLTYASSIAAYGAMEGHGTGPVSWRHAGEVASAFLTAVAKRREGAPAFDINGVASSVEDSLPLIKKAAPNAAITFSGSALSFPMDQSDQPVREHLGDYGSVPLEAGIRGTYEAFKLLLAEGLIKVDTWS